MRFPVTAMTFIAIMGFVDGEWSSRNAGPEGGDDMGKPIVEAFRERDEESSGITTSPG